MHGSRHRNNSFQASRGYFELPNGSADSDTHVRCPREGFTLIELLVVITLFAGMLSLIGMTFNVLMRSEKLVTQSLVTERTIARLAIQFRDDVHQSETGDVSPESGTIAKQLILKDSQGGRVRYQVTTEGVARLIAAGDATVAREDFRLPDCHVRLAAGGESDSSLRTLAIERPMATMTRNSQAPKPLRTLQIQAYLNRRPPTIRRADAAAASLNTTVKSDAVEESK